MVKKAKRVKRSVRSKSPANSLQRVRKEIARLRRASEKAQREIEAGNRARAELADTIVGRMRDVLRPADDDHPLVKHAMTAWTEQIVPDIELMIRGVLTPLTYVDSVPEPSVNATTEQLEERIASSERKNEALDADIRAGKMVRRVDAAAAIEASALEFARRLKTGLQELRASTDEPIAFVERSRTVVADAFGVFMEPMALPPAQLETTRKRKSQPSKPKAQRGASRRTG